MNDERILRFCKKQIEQERAKGGLFSKDKVEAYESVIDFMMNADKPKGDEVEQICEIFKKHYVEHMRAITKNDGPIQYSFRRYEKEEAIPQLLIPSIKAELGNNEKEFKDVTVTQFFDFFMTKLPLWWKQHQFNIAAIAKHFPTILAQIISYNHTPKGMLPNGSAKKATMADVLEDIKEEARGGVR